MKKSISSLTLGLFLSTLAGLSGSLAFGNENGAEPARDEQIYGKWHSPDYGAGRWKHSTTFEFTKEGASISSLCWAEDVEKFGPKIEVAYSADGKKLEFLNPNALKASETKSGQECVVKLPANTIYEYELLRDESREADVLAITISPKRKLPLRKQP